MNFYVIKYNNYFNRQYKRAGDTITDYNVDDNTLKVLNMSFNPANELVTSQVVNFEPIGDYCLVADSTGKILSRWFIVGTTRYRTGQYELSLKRDVLADYYEAIEGAPMFVEKGIIIDKSDTAIFNKEDLTLNQIKTAETPLLDEVGIQWLVAYIPRNSFETDKQLTIKDVTITSTADIEVSSLADWSYYAYSNSWHVSPSNIAIELAIKGELREPGSPKYRGYNTKFKADNTFISQSYSGTGSSLALSVSGPSWFSVEVAMQNCTSFTSSVIEELGKTHKGYNYIPDSTINSLLDLEGKIIKDKSTNISYTIGISYSDIDSYLTTSEAISYLASYVHDVQGIADNTSFKLYQHAIRLTLTPSYSTITATLLGAENRPHLQTQPYDMLVIPYTEGTKIYDNPNSTGPLFRVNQQAALRTAQQIATELGSGNIYDMQLLPYCPLRKGIALASGQNYIFNIKYITNSLIKEGSNTIGVILYSDTSALSFTIPTASTTRRRYGNEIETTPSDEWTKDYLRAKDSLVEKKVRNQTHLYRLCSTNYSNFFDFSVDMNGGVEGFKVDISYKPFSPYIHVSPLWSGLYGSNFNDSRGLICGGDYSISQATNVWADYQLNNKNYQAIFDRSIQHMQIENKYTARSENLGVLAGALGAASIGTGAGYQLGLGVGPSSIVGVGASAISGLLGSYDSSLKRELRQESLDWTRDNFSYQLGNIQALPQGLSKTDNFTPNTKAAPFLELYTCSASEEAALRSKIEYNGERVGHIGTISEFGSGYFKAQLIRTPLELSSHIVDEIASELNMGIFK